CPSPSLAFSPSPGGDRASLDFPCRRQPLPRALRCSPSSPPLDPATPSLQHHGGDSPKHHHCRLQVLLPVPFLLRRQAAAPAPAKSAGSCEDALAAKRGGDSWRSQRRSESAWNLFVLNGILNSTA
ncbi:Os11g0655000, partial [Oryza sativa Japonica Group]